MNDDDIEGANNSGQSSSGANNTQTLSNGSIETNETSSLAANKASPSHLPNLEYSQANLRQDPANVTLSSTSLSNRGESTGFRPGATGRIDDNTNSAHEFIFNGGSSSPPLPASPPPLPINSSHSNYEARRNDAAAPDSNPHHYQYGSRPSQGSVVVPGGIRVLPTNPTITITSTTNPANTSTATTTTTTNLPSTNTKHSNVNN